MLEKYKKCEDMELNGLVKRGRSLFVVVPTAPTENYEKFTEQVRKYNSKEPFNFETSILLKSFEKVKTTWIIYVFELTDRLQYVSIYAAYLYDSFKLYANALHQLLSEQQILTDQIIDEIASNGTKIVETIIKMKTYKSEHHLSNYKKCEFSLKL